jgi:hypothetical protein
VRRVDHGGDLRPRDPAIEPHAGPAERPDVRRHEVRVRLALDEHALHLGRRAQPHRDPVRAVMVIVERGELLASDEPAGRAVARPLGHVVEGQAGGPKLG